MRGVGIGKDRPRTLAPLTDHHKYYGMLIFTAEGPRSIDERDVIAVYCGDALGGYCSATLVLASGEEISGHCLVAAINRIENEIADQLLPPEAA
jgi:hypothetical protein